MTLIVQATALVLLFAFLGVLLYLIRKPNRQHPSTDIANRFRDDEFPNVFTVVARHHSFERGQLRSLSVIMAMNRIDLTEWLNNHFAEFEDHEINILRPAIVPEEYNDLISSKLRERIAGFRDHGKLNRSGYVVQVNDHIEYLDQCDIS